VELIKAEPTEDFPLAHYISPSGQWEMGVRQMIYGARVSGNRTGSHAFAFDYCGGANPGVIHLLLMVMLSILSRLPEATTERELEQMLPICIVKPIDRDPCWQKLQQLAIDLANSEEFARGD
jgi:hypothetical protein